MNDKPQAPLANRLLWFLALWVAGVVCVATVAYAIRFFIAR